MSTQNDERSASIQSDEERLDRAFDLLVQVDRAEYPEPVKAALDQAQVAVENAADVVENADSFRSD